MSETVVIATGGESESESGQEVAAEAHAERAEDHAEHSEEAAEEAETAAEEAEVSQEAAEVAAEIAAESASAAMSAEFSVQDMHADIVERLDTLPERIREAMSQGALEAVEESHPEPVEVPPDQAPAETHWYYRTWGKRNKDVE